MNHDLTPESRSLIIQVAKLQGIQVRRNEDTVEPSVLSDFWEWSPDGIRWHGHDRLAKNEEHFWQRLAEILTQWGIDPDATYELYKELPADIQDELDRQQLAQLWNRNHDTQRQVAETWVAWKQGELTDEPN